MTTIEKIRKFFPFSSIEPIVRRPSYETIHEMHYKLNTNSALVHTDLGGGTLGFLALIVPPAVYNTISNTPFIAPISMGPAPVILPN